MFAETQTIDSDGIGLRQRLSSSPSADAMNSPLQAQTIVACGAPALVARTMDALQRRNITARYVPTKEAALAAVLELLPKGARVAQVSRTA